MVLQALQLPQASDANFAQEADPPYQICFFNAKVFLLVTPDCHPTLFGSRRVSCIS